MKHYPHVILRKNLLIEDIIPAGFKFCQRSYLVRIIEYNTREAIIYKDLAWENLPVLPGCFVSFRVHSLFPDGNINKWGKECYVDSTNKAREEIWQEIRRMEDD